MDRYGKVAKRAGKPEDLPWQTAIALRWDRDLATFKIRAKKTGCNPSSRKSLKGFFI